MDTSRPARRRGSSVTPLFRVLRAPRGRLYLKLSGIRLEIEGEHQSERGRGPVRGRGQPLELYRRDLMGDSLRDGIWTIPSIPSIPSIQ